ncbi:Probable Zinc-ribbon domain-containing protein [Streptomyces sp. Ag109_G2-15]|nr:Probable Zinc-ribbon domain-containing protein [Streptomyces sp. Ag109_G2-15]
MSNLSNPGMALEDMRLSSTDRCQWRCSAEGCGHQWPARLQFRTRTVKPSGALSVGSAETGPPARENRWPS